MHLLRSQHRLAAAGACKPVLGAFPIAQPSSFHAQPPAPVQHDLRVVSSQRSVQARASSVPAADPQSTKYDVYINEPKPLKEGEQKHIISVFVADEAGLINRVAGVFARRGANIESLAVGLTIDKALFTIVVTGTENTVMNLVKQLSKLVKVRYVEDITRTDRIEREMVLMKLRAPPGPPAPRCCSSHRSSAPASLMCPSTRSPCVCRVTQESVLPHTEETREADVYMVDEEDLKGVWDVDNILEATYSAASGDYEAHTLSIEVQDVPGVLNQVTGVFARRGYNVQSLAVGSSEREGMSRICMVVPGTPVAIEKLLRQLNKLVFVQSVTDLTAVPFVNRELMLVKVRCTASQRGELRDLTGIFRADILDVSQNTLTIEILGKEDKMKALTDLLEPYGILEIARTGRVAVSRESGVDSKFLETVQGQRVY